jgi:hypothetical protein
MLFPKKSGKRLQKKRQSLDGLGSRGHKMSKTVQEAAAAVRAHYDADILLYFGPVQRPHDDFLIDHCPKHKKRKNVLLVISTTGGDANAAYRIARAIQNNYQDGQFLAYVDGVCASAGTLLVMGANKLILSPHAELGPIDVQLRKADEVGERTSGLTPIQALTYLMGHSMMVFRHHFMSMRFDTNYGLGFSTKLASQVSAEVTAELVGKLCEQIDPLRVAEVNRWLSIASEYGKRIARNVKEGGLERLLMAYPSHEFVIDPTEAKEIFLLIEKPPPCLEELGTILKPEADLLLDAKEPKVCYLKESHEDSTSKQIHNGKPSAASPGKPKPGGRGTPAPRRKRAAKTTAVHAGRRT